MGLFSQDIETLDDLFVHTLQDIYYAENQILKALPKMIKKASDTGLRQALSEHLEQTRTHVEAREQLTAWKAEFDEAVATAEAAAREAADAARKAASAAGIVSVTALVFGALAGRYGGLNSPLPDRDGLFGARVGRRVTVTR
jgi:ferritin-like metal-binding protein YciE